MRNAARVVSQVAWLLALGACRSDEVAHAGSSAAAAADTADIADTTNAVLPAQSPPQSVPQMPRPPEEIAPVAPQVTTPSDHEIVLTRTFGASRERVFAALTRPEEIAQWMKATGMQLKSCEVDLRVGGALRYGFVRPSGRKLEVRGVFREVDAPRRIVYLESYDFSPLEVVVTTTFESSGATTLFRQTLQYKTKAERDADYLGVATSSAEAHDELERYLQATRR